jgi:hypothetical protein
MCLFVPLRQWSIESCWDLAQTARVLLRHGADPNTFLIPEDLPDNPLSCLNAATGLNGLHSSQIEAGRPELVPVKRNKFYRTRGEGHGHAPEECGPRPEAAGLDSAPSACATI